jgi:hypothetical protein
VKTHASLVNEEDEEDDLIKGLIELLTPMLKRRVVEKLNLAKDKACEGAVWCGDKALYGAVWCGGKAVEGTSFSIGLLISFLVSVKELLDSQIKSGWSFDIFFG